MTHRKPTNAAVYGIDLGKNVFHIAGADADGAIIGNWGGMPGIPVAGAPSTGVRTPGSHHPCAIREALARSTVLVSRSTRPSSRKQQRAFQRFRA